MAIPIQSAMALTNTMGAIGGGSPTTQPETPDVAMSRAKQRIHDFAGGETGDFDVSLGGKYNQWIFYIGIVAAIYFIAKKKRQ